MTTFDPIFKVTAASSAEEVAALRAALVAGHVDAVATDHARTRPR